MSRYVVIARVPEDGFDTFDAYESAVLPLLADHGGTLERRLRSPDHRTEVHVVAFDSDTGLDSYRADPRRTAAADLLAASGASIDLIPVTDV